MRNNHRRQTLRMYVCKTCMYVYALSDCVCMWYAFRIPVSCYLCCSHSCFSHFSNKSDTKHKGRQHRILADSLTEEVIQPITLLRDQMSKKEIVLYSQYTNMNKELKQLEDSFKKNSVQYEKLYQTATSNISTCRKHGISNDEFKQVR